MKRVGGDSGQRLVQSFGAPFSPEIKAKRKLTGKLMNLQGTEGVKEGKSRGDDQVRQGQRQTSPLALAPGPLPIAKRRRSAQQNYGICQTFPDSKRHQARRPNASFVVEHIYRLYEAASRIWQDGIRSGDHGHAGSATVSRTRYFFWQDPSCSDLHARHSVLPDRRFLWSD